jgi:outer membrane protein OmpA-like peptidoglycan-associated protein
MKRIFSVLIFITSTTAFCQTQPPLPKILHEDFNSASYGWFETQSEKTTLQVRDGKYYFSVPDGGYMSFVSPYVDNSKDFSLEATFIQIDGKIDNGIGFIWGYDSKSLNNFTFTTNGNYRIYCADKTLGISDEWHPVTTVNPLGHPNKLKIEQRKGVTTFYLNEKEVLKTKAIPWYGKQVGFVAYTQMRFLVDDFVISNAIKLNLPEKVDLNVVKENAGFYVNSQYDDLSPKISADGKTLYFGRQKSPDNVGGVADTEDVWYSTTSDGKNWTPSVNIGAPVNTASVNNLSSVSTDNNTFLFHIGSGFSFMHRTKEGWSAFEDQGITFNNESGFLEGCLSPDGKAILFTAMLKKNIAYKAEVIERDIYVTLKQANGKWSEPFNAGKILNSSGNEYSPFLSADGRTLYFATNGRPGFGDVDIFMSKRLDESWTSWSEPVNLGPGINSVGFDAYYTLPASGEYGYMASNIKSFGLTDIVRFKLPQVLRPDPVVLVLGKVLNAKTKQPISAAITFDDLSSGKEIGEARSDPHYGDYKIALPAGKNYGFHAAVAGYLSVNENLELTLLKEYSELKKDLFLVPIEIGESIQLKNVFFVQSKAELKSESYPELGRLIEILKDNPGIEIELNGHTDNRGDAKANLNLSEARVEAVKSYLVVNGIIATRITGKGYGGTQPIVANDSDANRQLNRRVEFKITKK